MSASPLHPLMVHLPIALAVLLPIVTALMLLAWWRRWLPPRAWLVVLGLQGALALGSLAALGTGSREEERVERFVSEGPLEAHEEAGQVFTGAAFAVLLLLAAPLVVPGERLKRGLGAAGLAGTLVVTALGFDVGRKGGALVYTHGAASAYQASGGVATPVRAPADDDD